MPEGHTIHRLAARHNELLRGEVVNATSPQGRFSAGAALLSGSKLEFAEAYGKHLLHHYDFGLTLHVHLGLYGKFSDGALPAPPPIGELRMRLSNDHHWIDLRGPSACELLDGASEKALLDRLGIDPLRPDADPKLAFARLKKRAAPLGALLLDQSIIAGAGLIFVMECLYRAGLHPSTPGTALTPKGWKQIWGDLVALMAAAVVSGRIDTVRPKHMPEAMGRAPRVDRHGGEVYVYRRAGQPCLVCGTPIARGELNGRNTYWCPACQS
ncbi:endonuclease VIII [Rhizocola hellebori]|uniref:DNA-(apurinic or apyrimidinic site) lyase n=1 Tax=Rhizocola hellebori TaxID=1392758 RepID=A0A8J3QAL1_9ACTN|nr:Fpg/Nei family DNA glycosylase [Rhizocola hellebori]GIH06203.1 endonuclease VIII [Rhizocola hellebori]